MKYLTPAEASRLLESEFGIPRKTSTLAKDRCISSNGPAFVKAGRLVRYPEESLRDWARAMLSAPMRSTSGIR